MKQTTLAGTRARTYTPAKELQRKVDQAVKLIQTAGKDGQIVEVAYSGGKDSDVILELTRMSGINYRAIYKNTTIDPPGTIQHVESKGVEIRRPKKTFFQLIAQKGFPSRFVRFCCSELKEYKILERSIMGVRKAESVARNNLYSEPTKCLIYGSKKQHVEAFYPILNWSDKDVADFISAKNIQCHPLYYDEQGRFHVERRLGCMCCPLAYKKHRIEEFKRYPNMVKAYIRAGQKFRDNHPDAAFTQRYENIYDAFVRFLFYERDHEFQQDKFGLFGKIDCKKFLMDYFTIEL